MIKNTLHDTNPFFVHLPGNPFFSCHSKEIKEYIESKKEENKKLIVEFHIITWNSKYNQKKGLLETSCEKFGYEYEVLGVDTIWKNNRDKINLLIEYFSKNKINHKYIIGCDSYDVACIRKLDNIIELFKNFNCDLLFNAERRFWPPRHLPEIKNFENSIAPKNAFNKYLNAGLWIGKYDFCKHFFTYVKTIEKNLNIMQDSEQILIKQGHKKFDKNVKIDYNCVLFQNLNLQNHKNILLNI
jgi:hypothetical protein